MDPTCGIACTSTLPEIEHDPCSPKISMGQIAIIYLTAVDKPLTDWTDATEWSTRLDNTLVLADPIIALQVVGSRPVPESQEIEIDGGRKAYSEKEFSIPAKLYESNDINHEAVRLFECGGSFLMLGYTTVEGTHLYGREEGIVISMKADMEIGESSQEAISYPLEATWKHKYTEERIANPI